MRSTRTTWIFLKIRTIRCEEETTDIEFTLTVNNIGRAEQKFTAKQDWCKDKKGKELQIKASAYATEDTKKEKLVKTGALTINESRTSKKDLIIVLDPGHGHTKGITGGSVITHYKHYPKKKDGKPDESKFVNTKAADVKDYIIEDSKKDKENKEWGAELVQNASKAEYKLAYAVAVELEKLLSDYTVYKTRDYERKVGTDGPADRTRRNLFANEKKADYFISIHADGNNDYKRRGAMALYRTKGETTYDDRQKELAKDLISKYSVVPTVNKTPQKNDDLHVLSTSQNKTRRKALFEMGFSSNNTEYDLLAANISEIAEQLKEGLLVNINKNFCFGTDCKHKEKANSSTDTTNKADSTQTKRPSISQGEGEPIEEKNWWDSIIDKALDLFD